MTVVDLYDTIFSDEAAQDKMKNYKNVYGMKCIRMSFLFIYVYFLWDRVTPLLTVLFLASYCLRIFSLHAGGHRYFAHKSYDCVWWLKQILAYFICVHDPAAIFYWCYVHNDHHKV